MVFLRNGTLHLPPGGWFVIHPPTNRISNAYATAEEAMEAAKKFGARSAKFKPFGSHSGSPVFATKTGWQVMPVTYVSGLVQVEKGPTKFVDDDKNMARGRRPARRTNRSGEDSTFAGQLRRLRSIRTFESAEVRKVDWNAYQFTLDGRPYTKIVTGDWMQGYLQGLIDVASGDLTP